MAFRAQQAMAALRPGANRAAQDIEWTPNNYSAYLARQRDQGKYSDALDGPYSNIPSNAVYIKPASWYYDARTGATGIGRTRRRGGGKRRKARKTTRRRKARKTTRRRKTRRAGRDRYGRFSAKRFTRGHDFAWRPNRI